MKVLPVVLAAALFAPVALADAPSAELLHKLAAHQQRLDALQEQAEVVMSTRIEELNGDGEVVSTWESVMKSRKVAGEEKRDLVKAVKNGQDVTEERRKQMAEESGRGPGSNHVQMAKSPFSTSEQPRYVFDVVGPVDGNAALLKIAFEPKNETPDTGIGHAVVNTQTGEVTRLEFSPAELPTFVSKSDVSIEYGKQTSAGLAPSEMKFFGEGGFLFLKKRARGTVELDYSLASAANPAAATAAPADGAAAPAAVSPKG